MPELPTGTVTLLFTDIEGSTRLVSTFGNEYGALLNEHQRLLRACFGARDGVEAATHGDSFFVVFDSALNAVRAVADAQQAIAAHPWPERGRIRVRMGLHTGTPVLVGESYVGIDINRAARISAAANGGQVLVSASAKDAIQGELPDGLTLRDLGRHRLKDVGVEHLWQLDVEGLETRFGSLRSLEAHPSNVPAASGQLIGRDRELRELRELVRSARLVTVTGPGGVGKSLLTLGVAAELVPEFPDGIAYLDLAPLDDLDVVGAELADALGLHLDSGKEPWIELAEQLRGRETLLVLDTADRVRGLATAVGRLLSTCALLRILVTSRSPLHVSGEHEYPLKPLPLDAAVDLFADRARAVRPDFEVSDANRAALLAICDRLDGLPLAIELAASRIRVLTPQAIADRLARRVSVLAGGSTDAPARQKTLADTIAWSYESLDTADQATFRRIGVFASTFDLAGAEAIVGAGADDGVAQVDILEAIDHLVDRSLVSATELDGEPRFRLLRPIRDFALDQLDASGTGDAMREAHARQWLELVIEFESVIDGPGAHTHVARIRREMDEFRAALEWSLGDPERVGLGLELAAHLGPFWYRTGQVREGSSWLERAVEAAGDAAPEIRAGALYWSGVLLDEIGEEERAAARLEVCLELQRELGDERAAGRTLNSLGIVALRSHDLPRARALIQEALERRRAIGDLRGIASGLTNLGIVTNAEGDLEAARDMFEQAIEADVAAGETEPDPAALVNLGILRIRTGQLERGAADVRQALTIFAELDDEAAVATCLRGLAEVAAANGDAARAIRLAAAADRLRLRAGARADYEEEGISEVAVSAAAASLPEATAAELRAEGAAMDVAAAVAYGLEGEVAS